MIFQILNGSMDGWHWHLLMPNDIVTRNHLLLNKSMLDMDKFTALRSDYSIYVPVEV